MSKGKRFALFGLVLALLVLVWTVFDHRGVVVDQWYLWKLDSNDPGTRQYAEERLGERGSARVISHLMENLREEAQSEFETECVSRSTRILKKIGEKAVPALIQALKDPNSRVRRAALEVLQQMGPEAQGAIPALVDSLTSDPDVAEQVLKKVANLLSRP